MLQGLFLHCRKSSMLPRCIWAAGAHTGEERELYRGSGIVVSKELLDVLELQGCLHVRVVKDSSSKLPRGFFCAFYLPFVLSSMHGLLCFFLLGLSKLLLQIQFPFTLLIRACSLAPCFSCVCMLQLVMAQGRLAVPGAGSTVSVCLSVCLSGWVMGGITALPSQEQGRRGTHCRPSKAQQSTKLR